MDRAILAEIGAWFAVLEIEGHQPEVRSRGQDSLGACACRPVGVAPQSHAAAVEHVGRAIVGLDLRVVAPQLPPRTGIERHHGVERRASDQFVADEDRGDLEFRALEHVWGPSREIAGMVGPGRDQLTDIPWSDLVECGKAASALIVAIIFGGAGTGQREDRERQAGEPAQSVDPQVLHPRHRRPRKRVRSSSAPASATSATRIAQSWGSRSMALGAVHINTTTNQNRPVGTRRTHLRTETYRRRMPALGGLIRSFRDNRFRCNRRHRPKTASSRFPLVHRDSL